MRVDPFYVVNLSSALDQTQATQQQLSQELSSGRRFSALWEAGSRSSWASIALLGYLPFTFADRSWCFGFCPR